MRCAVSTPPPAAPLMAWLWRKGNSDLAAEAALRARTPMCHCWYWRPPFFFAPPPFVVIVGDRCALLFALMKERTVATSGRTPEYFCILCKSASAFLGARTSWLFAHASRQALKDMRSGLRLSSPRACIFSANCRNASALSAPLGDESLAHAAMTVLSVTVSGLASKLPRLYRSFMSFRRASARSGALGPLLFFQARSAALNVRVVTRTSVSPPSVIRSMSLRISSALSAAEASPLRA
mmetsp:Transcript_10976/g.32503  ORF Transcript_10976/g.32503 Transcript_10976/m.32503 type:complete len:238 (-) Transcript_10976:2988-3701(-)